MEAHIAPKIEAHSFTKIAKMEFKNGNPLMIVEVPHGKLRCSQNGSAHYDLDYPVNNDRCNIDGALMGFHFGTAVRFHFGSTMGFHFGTTVPFNFGSTTLAVLVPVCASILVAPCPSILVYTAMRVYFCTTIV